METINITEVLSIIRSTTAQTSPFLIVFVKSRSRSRGQIRTIAKCLKGFPTKQEEAAASGSTKGKFLYKEHDVIPLIDIEAGHKLRTIPISHIIGFNQYKVLH